MAFPCLGLVSYLGTEHWSPRSPPSRGPPLPSKPISLLPYKSNVLRKIKGFDHAVIITEFRPTLLVIRNLITTFKISQQPPKYYLYSFFIKGPSTFLAAPQLFLRRTTAWEAWLLSKVQWFGRWWRIGSLSHHKVKMSFPSITRLQSFAEECQVEIQSRILRGFADMQREGKNSTTGSFKLTRKDLLTQRH